MSIHVPRRALNHAFVVLLVLNCWLSPLVHHFAVDKSRQRLLCLLLDVALDFIGSIGISVVLATTYIRQFDFQYLYFPLDMHYTDKAFVNYVNEMQIILLSTWTDAVGRLVFSLGLLVGLSDVKTLIVSRTSHAVAPAPGPQLSFTVFEVKPKYSRFVLWCHRIIAVYGATILVTFIYAELGDTANACGIPVRPWLTRQKGCALLEVNCHPRVIGRVESANAAKMRDILSAIDAPSLAQLSLRHCHDVEIIPELQRFRSILAMKLFNVTVLSWPTEAALHRDYHQRITKVYVVHTKFPGHALPPGLLSPLFPISLSDVEFSFTNLRSLPSNLHELWHKKMVLYFEFAEMSYLPASLAKLETDQLSLNGNPFESVPADLLVSPGLDYLAFAFSSIDKLPAMVDTRNITVLRKLRFEHTDVSELPPWMDEQFLSEHDVYAAETPFCRRLLTRNETSAGLARVDCTDISETAYPLHVEQRDDESW
ncbi:hypothetical protein PINS_up020689 [Pythium insidiosum]|nr:hypothetical protein PINS_up020689 [Pythium insidiosum]